MCKTDLESREGEARVCHIEYCKLHEHDERDEVYSDSGKEAEPGWWL